MDFCYNKSHLVTQYKIENLIITDYHNDTTYYDDYIFDHNKKQDLYQKNNDIMRNHFKNKFGF
jgi:spore coat protein CotF